jgi:predicted nicotinamide N-methyase
MATSLATLKFTSAKKPSQLSPVQFRRNKLVGRIDEQIALATAQAEGRTFAPTRQKTVKNEDGVRSTVQAPKRVKQWWFTADNGKIALTVRYGAKTLELVKGKNAIEVATAAQLVPTLELLKAAADGGEMDAAIEAAGVALRKGFAK